MKHCVHPDRIGDRDLQYDHFYKDSGTRDGYMSKCKSCHKAVSAASRSWKANDPAWRTRFNEQNTKSRRAAGKEGQMFSAAMHRARRRGIEFTITKADIVIPTVCPVLGIPIISGIGRKSDDPTNRLVGAIDNSPSLDRIDNNAGYTADNIQVISWRANYLKNNATLEELIKLGEYAHRLLTLTKE